MRSIILLSALFSLAACAESTPSQTADTPVEPPTMTMDKPTLDAPTLKAVSYTHIRAHET